MAMEVKIHKKLGEYELDVHWKSTKKRIGILGASGSGKTTLLKMLDKSMIPEGRLSGKAEY